LFETQCRYISYTHLSYLWPECLFKTLQTGGLTHFATLGSCPHRWQHARSAI